MNSAFNSDVALCSAPDLVTPPRALSSPERLAAEALLATKKSVARVFEDPLLTTALRSRDYDRDALAYGDTLAAAAEAEFVNCQAVLGELDEATRAFEEAWTTTRDDYMEFRGVIRSLFAPSECAALFNVYGQIAAQLTPFTAQATLSYTRALDIKALERAGYDESWLHSALSALQNLVELDATVRQRAALAAEKSAARNHSLARYMSWARALVQEARAATALLHHPPA